MADSSVESRESARMAKLEEAFEVFTRTSRQLSESYAELEAQVASLTDELTAARDERLREMAEKERIGRRLEQLLQALPGGVIVIDQEGRVRDPNPAAEALLGGGLAGQPWETVKGRAFTSRDATTGEVALRTGRRVSISQRTLEPEQERIVLLTDVSETRALQDLVDRQQRLAAIGEMAARLAHQIRTPVSAALLYAGQIENGRLGQTDLPRVGGKLADRLRQLERMIGNMLMFAGGGRRDDERLGVDELFAEAAGQIMARWRGRIDLSVDGGRGLVLEGSRAAILGAITNLLNNAAEAVQDPSVTAPEVRLSARRERERILIRVQDNGPGLPEGIRDKVFEPFFTTRPHGTGLGLAVVQSVAQVHEGELSLGTAPGGGAEFLFMLPAATDFDTVAGGVPRQAGESR